MKSLLRWRQPLAVVAVIVLAACDAGQNVSPNGGAVSSSLLGPTRMVFDHRGKFAAEYSGSYSKEGDCSATATFTYNGNGHARFLHSSVEEIKLVWFCGSQGATGSATLTSTRVPKDSITASVSSSDFKSPCYDFAMSYTVTGGTGKFRRASGSGTIAVHMPSSECLSYSYRDKWKGTLKF